MDGPRPAAARQRDRLADDEVLGAGCDAEARLDQRPQHRLMIEDLVGVTFRQGLIDAAGDEDERHAILLRIGHDIDRIRDPGTERSDQDGQRARHVPEPFRHEAGGVLVLGQAEPDPGPLQRVDQCEDLAARNAERMGRACGGQPGRNRVGAAGLVLCRLARSEGS